MGLFDKSVMLRRAEAVAAFLMKDPRIAAVYLFGGLARTGDSRHDMDLIVVPSDPARAEDFLQQLNAQIGEMEVDDLYFGGPEVRFGIFYSLFGKVPGFGSNLYTLLGGTTWERVPGMLDAGLPFIEESKLLDVFVLPADWRTSEMVKQSLRTRDPDFLANVARDAVRFDPGTGAFAFPSWRRSVVFPLYQLWRNYTAFEWRGVRSNWLILSGILSRLEFIRRQRSFRRDQAIYRASLAVIRRNEKRRKQALPAWLRDIM